MLGCEKSILMGTGVVAGIGWGFAVYIQPGWFQEKKSSCSFYSVDNELARLQEAFTTISNDLERLSEEFAKEHLIEEEQIVSAQLVLLKEGVLSHEIQAHIRSSGCTIEKAVCAVRQYIQSHFDNSQTSRTFELIEDIFDRILTENRAAEKQKAFEGVVSKQRVLLADTLYPSRATELLQRGFSAIVTKRGGLMSHAALLARSKNIPFVTNFAQNDWEMILSAKKILVDGQSGAVYLDPPRTELIRCQKKHKKLSLSSPRAEPTLSRTLDGVTIEVLASMEYCSGMNKEEIQTTDGVGLYRSEYLVQELGYLPLEKTQVAAFQHLIDLAGQKPVTIRVFDFSGDKQWVSFDQNKLPFQVHLRSLSELIASPSIFFAHIRAIVRAASSGNVSILFPMISSLHEFRHCKKILDAARLSIVREGGTLPSIKIGVMVELPSIICQLPELLQEVDFIALGTNDLIQYCLAISRMGEGFSDRSGYLHEGFMALLKYISDTCKQANKRCMVCGEMTVDPGMCMLLLGLGFTSFTLPIRLVSEVKKTFAFLNAQEAKKWVDMLFTLPSAQMRFEWLEKWKKDYVKE